VLLLLSSEILFAPISAAEMVIAALAGRIRRRHGGFMKGRNVNEIIHRAAVTDNGNSNVLFPKGEQVDFWAQI